MVHVNFQIISSVSLEIRGVFLKSSIFEVNIDSKHIKSMKWELGRTMGHTNCLCKQWLYAYFKDNFISFLMPQTVCT